jgi:hypothetical protein
MLCHNFLIGKGHTCALRTTCVHTYQLARRTVWYQVLSHVIPPKPTRKTHLILGAHVQYTCTYHTNGMVPWYTCTYHGIRVRSCVPLWYSTYLLIYLMVWHTRVPWYTCTYTCTYSSTMVHVYVRTYVRRARRASAQPGRPPVEPTDADYH